MTVTLICKQRQHSLSKSSDQEKEFDLSEANKFRVNSLECKAYNNINNKQYSTISLYFSYYLDGQNDINHKNIPNYRQKCEGESANLRRRMRSIALLPLQLCTFALAYLNFAVAPSHLRLRTLSLIFALKVIVQRSKYIELRLFTFRVNIIHKDTSRTICK